MEPCRSCGTPFTGDTCPLCGVQRGVDAWYPAPPSPNPPISATPAVNVPLAASGPITPVSNWTPPIATTPYGTPPPPPFDPTSAYGTPPGPTYAAAPPYGTLPPPPPPPFVPTSAYGTPPAPTYAAAPPYGTPAQYGQGGPSQPYPPAAPQKPGSGRHLPWIAGVLAGLLVIGLSFLAISGGLFANLKPGAASGAPTQKTTTKASRGQTTQTPFPTLEQSSPAYPDVSVPAGSKECARVGSGPFDAVGTANESTSCPFAVNVRDAYVAAGLNGAAGHVTASSPVTGQTYDITCSGVQPVLCTGGVAARIVIYGGRLVVG